MKYTCGWDLTVSCITLVVILFLIGIMIFVSKRTRKYLKGKDKFILYIVNISTVILCLGTILITGLFLPLSLSLNEDSISINQVKGKIEIQSKDIIEVRRTKKIDLENSIRVFGSGGFFGYLGYFESAQLGDYQSYVTDVTKKILIKTSKKNYIVSCDNPDDFIDKLFPKLNH